MGGLETLGVSLTTCDLDCSQKQILNIAFDENSMRTERISCCRETWREKNPALFSIYSPTKNVQL